MSEIRILNHPLVDCHLSVLRSEATRNAEFRQSVKRLSTLLAYDATAHLETERFDVQTPLTRCDGFRLKKRVGLVPILRAGVAMVEPMLELIPTSEVWHLGMYRDEDTAQPVHYYSKLPPSSPVDVAFVLDPMLATGGSAAMAIEALQQWGVKQIIETCREVTGHEIPAVEGERRPGDPPELVADASLAKDVLGWEPEYRTPKPIIETAWAWHQSNPHGYAKDEIARRQ